MDMEVIDSASLVYVQVPIFAKSAGAAINPSTDVVSMAFLTTEASPTAPDWKSASWDTDATTTPPTYRAQCLVGPGGTVTLTDGTYAVWVKVNDNPEIPVLRSPRLLRVT